MRSPSLPWIVSIGRVAAFVYLASTIMVMASERVYWYWAGFNWDSVLFIGAFYLIPVAGALWAMAHGHATKLHHVILGGAVFGFLVEGVLTPIIYADGLLPVFAMLFVGWHGLLALVGFWYLGHTWLIERRTKLLAAVSAGFGALWGVWAMASSIGDSDSAIEGIYTTTIDPASFATYTFGVGATLAIAHWLIGWVWPTRWRPSKWSTILITIVGLGYMSVAEIVVVPWAPLKLAVLVGGSYWLMTRGMAKRSSTPSVFDRLAGKVRARDAVVILLMPAAATLTYWMTWSLDMSDGALQAVFFFFNTMQVLGGGAAFVWAAVKSLKERGESVTEPDVEEVSAAA